MREIKFRMWIKNQNRMVGPLSIHELHPHWSFPLHWGELMQYTGLKDKNGIEIYEGDIVKLKGSGEKEIISKVTFGSYGACVKDRNYHNRISALDRDNNSILTEVIGNIFESPELLEK